MKNFEKNAKKITKAITEFVQEQFKPLNERDKVKKIGEFLEGFQGTKRVNGNLFVILQLPEGHTGAIDLRGNLYDLNEVC